MREETALRKERKKRYAIMYMYMYMYKLYKDAHNRIYTQTPTGSLGNHIHIETEITTIRVTIKDEN